MKNLVLAVLALFFAVPCALASNMKMVTYFPVPYASYNDVSVTGTMDVGLINACGLNCGQGLQVLKNATGRTLDTGTLIVRQGGLNLNSSKAGSLVKGLSFKAGGGAASARAVFEFKHDLNMAAVPAMQTLEATHRAYLSGLTLFPAQITAGNSFPACESMEISWQKLKVGDTEEAFLVCGTGKTVEQTCQENPRQEKCCTGGQQWTGSACQCPSGQEWNGSECKAVSGVTPVIKQGVALVACNSSGVITRYHVCTSGALQTNTESHHHCECVKERQPNGRWEMECTSEINDPYEFEEAISDDCLSDCAGTDYQALCDRHGAGYRCGIASSASGRCGEWYNVVQCDCSGSCDADSDGECECMEDWDNSDRTRIYADGLGSATYMVCQPK